MLQTLNLKSLAAEAFGYSGPRSYQIPTAPTPEPARAVPGTPELHGEGRGLLGLPVFCRLNFEPIRTDAGLFAGLELLDPIITVSQPLNILSTTIAGRRRGTVKEFIGEGDFEVSIKGILATDPHAENRFAYPLEQVQLMREMAGLGVALPVTGWLLDVYGIKNLVIKTASYPELPGFTNLQAFELQCLSDEPIELIL